MRRTLFLTTALLTFVLGTTSVCLQRRVHNRLSEPAVEAIVPSVEIPETVTPLRIGIFIGVDAATVSADGQKFGLYEDYDDREMLVPISPTELSDVVNQLRSAGLFEEAEVSSPFFVSLPQTFTIMVAWPDKVRRFTWITGYDCQVPEKYLQILERLNRNRKLKLIQDFIAYNSRQVVQRCYHP